MSKEQWYLNTPNNIYKEVMECKRDKQKEEAGEIVVAVIDGGIDFSHEDLQGLSWSNCNEVADGLDNDGNGYIDDVYGWDFCATKGISQITTEESYYLHGTAIAGIIGAQHNHIGISGIVSKHRVKIMSLRVLNEEGQGDIDDVVSAIEYAESMGARICSMSFSTEVYSEELDRVIKDSKMLFITSAGNHNPLPTNLDREGAYIYPQCLTYENIIVVAAFGPDGKLSDFSNYGANMVDVAAPGDELLTTAPGNAYKEVYGTSYAVPFVTAVAASLLCDDSSMSALELRSALFEVTHYDELLSGKVGDNRKLL